MTIQLKNYDPALMQGADLDISVDLGEILDSNNNTILEFDAVTSSVNYLRIADAATLTDPVLSTQGTDTAINLQLTPTGTGKVLIGNSSTATVAGGSASVNAQRGTVTTASLTTASGSVHSFDLLNNKITASSQIFTSVTNGSNTTGIPVVSMVTVGTAGSARIDIANAGFAVFNGTLKVNFLVVS